MNGKLTATLSARGRLKATLSKAIERVEPTIKPIEITKNGEYSVPAGVHGFNPVKVDVPLRYEEGYEDGYQASQDSITLQEKTITENGEVVTDEGFTGMSKVIVAVPIKEKQEKTVEITANGTVEVVPDEGKTLSKVTANVAVNPTDVGKPYIDTSKMTSFADFFRYNTSLVSEVDKLDTSNSTSFSGMFYGCKTLQSFPTFDTSNGTNFGSMFYNCGDLTTIPPLDTSKGTDFSGMFYACFSLKSIPPLDTSNGTNFGSMFYNCINIATIPLLDTSNGTTFSNMFQYCGALTTIPLLDVHKSAYCHNLFNGCTSLETVSLTISKAPFQTTTFQGCTALKNITIGEGWAVNIYLHYSNNLTVESLHGMIENLADLTGKTAKTFQIGATNLAKIDEEHINMLKAKNWNYS